jgi:beta-aspartyl-peptidase (threonine type)
MTQTREGQWALIVHGGAKEKALEQLPGVGGAEGDGGGIGIAKDGRIGWAHNSPDFAIAYATSEMDEPRAFLRKDEEKSG